MAGTFSRSAPTIDPLPLTPSLPHSLPPSLPASLPPSLPPALPPSPPPSRSGDDRSSAIDCPSGNTRRVRRGCPRAGGPPALRRQRIRPRTAAAGGRRGAGVLPQRGPLLRRCGPQHVQGHCRPRGHRPGPRTWGTGAVAGRGPCLIGAVGPGAQGRRQGHGPSAGGQGDATGNPTGGSPPPPPMAKMFRRSGPDHIWSKFGVEGA